MKRLLGLDVGRRRIGIALSDPLGLTAQPLEVWRSRGIGEDVAHIKEVCARVGVTRIVLGKPLRTDGTEGPEVLYVRAFAEALAAAIPDVEIALWDERFTTQEAERSLMQQGLDGRRRRQVVDMAAAALILQAYMERSRHRE